MVQELGYRYVQAHGSRLGWIKTKLAQAGVDVLQVLRGADGYYYLTIDAADEKDAAQALEDVTNYKKRERRTPLEVQATYWLLGAGVAVAALCALVSLAAGAIVAVMTVAFFFVMATQLLPAARYMRAAGGRYSRAADAGLVTILLVFGAFLVFGGYVAAAAILSGNSALVLVGR